MFSIKIISYSGWESVTPEITLVEHFPARVALNGKAQVQYYYRDGKEVHYNIVEEGRIYVMNENGKTVANYDLGGTSPATDN